MNRVWDIAAAASVFAILMGVSAAQAQQPEPGKAPPGCGPRVLVEYTDDDPDFFIIKNRSPEGWTLLKLGIDLAATSGNLVFDTDFGGIGAGTPADFHPGSSPGIRLTGSVPAQDGGKAMALSFEGFEPGRDFNFSVDLDALHSGESRTWVMPQDMKDGRVAATFAGPSQQEDTIDAIFDERATADSGAGGCV